MNEAWVKQKQQTKEIWECKMSQHLVVGVEDGMTVLTPLPFPECRPQAHCYRSIHLKIRTGI